MSKRYQLYSTRRLQKPEKSQKSFSQKQRILLKPLLTLAVNAIRV
jgi:hypothetical protein